MGPKEEQFHRGRHLDTIGEFVVIDCEVCGFKHLVPLPSPDDLQAIYRHEYYTREKPKYIERHREDLEWWNFFYDRLYGFFEKCLPSGQRRILDVGSGPGFFLLRGKNRGWQTVGIEPSTQAAAQSQQLGLEVWNTFFTAAATEKMGSFDVVHLQEVLEHLPNPGETLGLAVRLLNPGGLLCVIVPNDYNPLQQVLRIHLGFPPWWLAPPHHINYFSFASLGRLIRSHGLEIIRETGTFPMEVFLLMGECYVGNDSIGRRMHEMRKTLELNLARAQAGSLLDEFYTSLAQRDLGRECVVVARKPPDGSPPV